MRVIGYTRVSTGRQVESGLGLEAQRAAIEAEVERRGWTLVGWTADEGISGGKGVKDRPGLAEAVDRIESGEADGLIASRLDRVARSVIHFADLLERADRRGWALVMVDQAVDTSTPQGRFVVQVMSAVAELERSLIGERTSAGLQAKKRRGEPVGGWTTCEAKVADRIVAELDDGHGPTAVARMLTGEGIPTPTGNVEWKAGSVRSIAQRRRRDIENGVAA